MNNFDNNDNNSYGEYHVPPTNSDPGNKNGKGKKVAALAILIVVCMIMSSIGTSFMITYLYDNGKVFGSLKGPENVGGESAPSTDKWSGGVKDPVTITKNPDDKVNVIEGTIGTENMSVAQIAALVADSVVEITTSSVQYDIFYGQQVKSGAGSGVIIGKSQADETKYYIVTNHHVIDGVESISVRLRDGSDYPCTLIGSDVISDIGVLQIVSDKELTVAELGNSDNITVGEDIVVIGNPLGKLGGTVTNGIISALERKVNIDGLNMTLLQHNAAISPGNSGGGMFDSSGYLIGVINAKSVESSAEGLGFAIPINYAYDIIEDILNYGYVTDRASLPFSIQEYSSSNMFGAVSSCVVVTSQNGSGDIKFNDVIYSIDGVQVSTHNEITSLLVDYNAGDTVSLKVARTVGRDVKLYTYNVTLVEYSPSMENS